MGRPRTGGCNSCRRLKIGCSKDKPKCEYCTAQGKECVYEDTPAPATNRKVKKPPRKPRARAKGRSVIKLTSPPQHEPQTPPDDDVESINFDNIPTVLEDASWLSQMVPLSPLASTKGDVNDNVRRLLLVEEALVSLDQLSPRAPDVVHSPLNNFMLSLNSVQRHLDVSSLEVRLSHFFNVWSQKTLFQSRDKIQVELWTRILPSLFNSRELVRKAVCAFSAIALLAQSHPGFLLDDHYAASDSAKKLFQFGMDSFGKLVEYILLGLARINSDEEVSIEELQALFLGQTMMFATLACSSRKSLPAVDFETRNDVLSIARGLSATLHRCSSKMCHGVLGDIVDIVKATEISANTPLPSELGEESPLMSVPLSSPTSSPLTASAATPTEYPISEHVMRELEKAGYDDATTATLRQALRVFNFCIRQSIEYTSPVPFCRFLALCDDSLRELIYAKQPLALAFMAIVSAIYLMTRNWFHRKLNIWVDYLEWYRWYQPVPYPWEIAMYRVVLDYEYTIEDYDDCITFDFNKKYDEIFGTSHS